MSLDTLHQMTLVDAICFAAQKEKARLQADMAICLWPQGEDDSMKFYSITERPTIGELTQSLVREVRYKRSSIQGRIRCVENKISDLEAERAEYGPSVEEVTVMRRGEIAKSLNALQREKAREEECLASLNAEIAAAIKEALGDQ